MQKWYRKITRGIPLKGDIVVDEGLGGYSWKYLKGIVTTRFISNMVGICSVYCIEARDKYLDSKVDVNDKIWHYENKHLRILKKNEAVLEEL